MVLALALGKTCVHGRSLNGPRIQRRKILVRSTRETNNLGKGRIEEESGEGASNVLNQEKNVSKSGKPMGWSFFPKGDEDANDETPNPKGDEEDDDEYLGGMVEEYDGNVSYDLISPGGESPEDLPEVTREQILAACASVNTGICIVGYILRGVATKSPQVMGNDQSTVDALLNFSPQWEGYDIILIVVVVAIVTAGRKVLMSTWTDFAIATNRSNQQILGKLGGGDILVISFLPGFCEEFLFRTGVIPATFVDWRGAAISGVAFGLLHNSGGRNLAFSAWASAVGTLYGLAFLSTQNMYVPMLSHSLANVASAYLWLNDNKASNES